MTSKFSMKGKKTEGGLRWPNFWSISRLESYEGCPKQYFYAHVMKIKGPPVAAMERGTTIHKLAESFLRGLIKGIPKELRNFENELKQIKKLGAKPEENWATDQKWEPCAGDDFQRAWVRAKTDAHLFVPAEKELTIIDFKTGRAYDRHEEAGKLYAVIGAAQYPQAEKIDAEFWYLDSGESKAFTFVVKGIKTLKREFEKRAAKMLNDRDCKIKPGEACRYCPFRSDKTINGAPGQCDGWKRA